MQKFEESHEALSERHNIVVMADEAHRGQYGLTETVDAKTGKVKSVRLVLSATPYLTLHISVLQAHLFLQKTVAPVKYSVTISTFTI